MTQWYDRKEAIELAVRTSYSEFLKIVRSRREAGYVRHERLSDWIVLGRYWLDTVGNTGKIVDTPPKEDLPMMPNVLSPDELHQYMKLVGREERSIGWGYDPGLPPEDKVCPECRTGWHIHNCHDAVVRHEHPTIDLTPYLGSKLSAVATTLNSDPCAMYYMQSDLMVRNDRFIDLTLRYPEPKSDLEKGWVKNERGWTRSDDGIDENYVVQPGDEGAYNRWTYYHTTCYQHYQNVTERAYFADLFQKAQIAVFTITAIPNGYTRDKLAAPWFVVEADRIEFAIGWRKRVMHISCNDCPDFRGLFKNEDVTIGANYIHAHSVEKAVEYLKRIQPAAMNMHM